MAGTSMWKSQDIAGYAQASWECPEVMHYRRVSWECPEVIWVVLAPLGGPSGKFQNIQKSCEQCQHGWTSWEGSPSTTGRSIWEVPEHCWVVPGPRHHEKASWEDQVGMARSHVGNPSMTGMSIWEVPGHCWVVPGIMGRSVGDAQKSYGQSSTTWRSIWEVPGYCWIVLGIMGSLLQFPDIAKELATLNLPYEGHNYCVDTQPPRPLASSTFSTAKCLTAQPLPAPLSPLIPQSRIPVDSGSFYARLHITSWASGIINFFDCEVPTHPSVPLSASATSHNDDNPTGATQQHIHLCHSRPVQQATTMTTQRVQHSSTSICAPNAPACTTGHCGLYSAIVTMQRSHAPDDTTQLCNAPACHASDDATQLHNAPACNTTFKGLVFVRPVATSLDRSSAGPVPVKNSISTRKPHATTTMLNLPQTVKESHSQTIALSKVVPSIGTRRLSRAAVL
ncbi:hypothetical protein BU15DRAFT_68925 [Melanogaster broomeanus]|nr:hypothetical protein BU15DRAFT_68925 [Melanogaster broomeanus]